MFSYIHLFIKFLLGDSRVLLTDPELIKYVVVTNAKNYRRSEFVRQVLPSIGNGLFSSNGKDHAFQRKLITPAFHFSNLVGMVEHFEDVAHNLVQVNLTFNILNLIDLSAIIQLYCFEQNSETRICRSGDKGGLAVKYITEFNPLILKVTSI